MNEHLKRAVELMDEAANMFRQACDMQGQGLHHTAAAMYELVSERIREANALYNRDLVWTVEEVLANAG